MKASQTDIARLSTQLQTAYLDFQEASLPRYRFLSQVILTNLTSEGPILTPVRPLIQYNHLPKSSQALKPVFEYAIKNRWPVLMLNKGLTARFTQDPKFAEFTQPGTGDVWRFTVGRHPEIPGSSMQWWKMEHFTPEELQDDDSYDDAIEEGFEDLYVDQAVNNTYEGNPLGCSDLDTCCICMSSENLVRMNVCGCYFHSECIHQWIRTGRNDCPICGQHLLD
jgi:hypothetical protein